MQLANWVQIDAIRRDARLSPMDVPADHPTAEALQLHELAEAHTALGFYLCAVKLMVEGNPRSADTRLREAIEACIGQSERADIALRRLRRLLTGRGRGDPNPEGC
jgi:hypothetical protein